MSKIPVQYIERQIKTTFTEKELEENKFSTVSEIGPMTILRISEQFKSLNLAKEDLSLLYDHNLGTMNGGFLLTDCNIHFRKGFISLDDIEELFDEEGGLRPPFPELSEEFKVKLAEFFLSLAEYDEVKDSNSKRYGRGGEVHVEQMGKAEESIPPETAIKKDIIDREYLSMLQHEAKEYERICKELDEDAGFKKTLQNMTNKTDVAVNTPSAKELFLQDSIKIFEMCNKADVQSSRREQFALVYIYERLLGDGDMKNRIKLSRINDLLENEQFQKNFENLLTAKIFNVKGEFPEQLLLPVILSKLDHELFASVAAHLYRFASIVTKADGKVTSDEEKMLKEVWKLAHEPKKSLPNVKQTEVSENETLEDVIAELNELIGLKAVKQNISTLINFLKVQKIREEKGLKVSSKSLHSVFMGPPGTGKTTIARLVARIYKHLGILSKGHLVETDRAGVVAGYIGQTAIKMDKVMQTALDGLLFIDEAYALSRGGGDKRDFGNEAIEALLKRMEDYRKRMVVIVAGYPDEMETFINSNPGIKSRFNRYFYFDHYKPQELLDIFKLFARKADFKLNEDAEEKLLFIFEKVYDQRTPNFGNARVSRNLLDKCIERQANRIVSIAPLTEEILVTLIEDDVPPVNETVQEILVFDPKKKKKEQAAGIPENVDLGALSKILNPAGGVDAADDGGDAAKDGGE